VARVPAGLRQRFPIKIPCSRERRSKLHRVTRSSTSTSSRAIGHLRESRYILSRRSQKCLSLSSFSSPSTAASHFAARHPPVPSLRHPRRAAPTCILVFVVECTEQAVHVVVVVERSTKSHVAPRRFPTD